MFWNLLKSFRQTPKTALKRPAVRPQLESLEGRDLMTLAVDLHYGQDGTVAARAGNLAANLVVQSDGKTVEASSLARPFDFVLFRRDTDGKLDPSFGTKGVATIDHTGMVRALALQSDGKIIVAGNDRSRTQTQFTLARVNAGGELDATFGTGGLVKTPLAGNADEAISVVVQSDGKIVAGGFFTDGAQQSILVRYLPDGTLDTTFGGDGIVDSPILPQRLEVQKNGRLLVSGQSPDHLQVARFGRFGQVDTAFGAGGVATVQFAQNEQFGGLDLQDDGKIVVGGFVAVDGRQFLTLARLTTDGQLDTNFSQDGKFSQRAADETESVDLALRANGNIVVAQSNTTQTVLTEYTPLGNLDRTGWPGRMTLPLKSLTHLDVRLTAAAGGAIYVSGTHIDPENPNAGWQLFATRLIQNESPVVVSLRLTPQQPAAGTQVTLTAVGSDRNQTAATLKYHWRVLGPDGFEVHRYTRIAKFTPPKAGRYSVSMVLTDDYGARGGQIRHFDVA